VIQPGAVQLGVDDGRGFSDFHFGKGFRVHNLPGGALVCRGSSKFGRHAATMRSKWGPFTEDIGVCSQPDGHGEHRCHILCNGIIAPCCGEIESAAATAFHPLNRKSAKRRLWPV